MFGRSVIGVTAIFHYNHDIKSRRDQRHRRRIMQNSNWQQIGSQYGASFTLIGLFESPTAAHEAAHTIRAVIEQIAAWHRANPTASEQLFRRYVPNEGEISPPEAAAAAEFHIHWKSPVLWFGAYEMKTFAHFIFIQNKAPSPTGAYPISELVNRLGGEVFVQGDLFGFDLGSELQLRISCTAPDVETAVKLAADWQGWQSGPHVFDITFDDDTGPFLVSNPDDLLRAIRAFKVMGCSEIKLETIQVRNHALRFDDGEVGEDE